DQIMQFISLFTSANPNPGPPDAEHMAEMGALMERMSKAGILIATGGIGRSEEGFKLTLKAGKYSTSEGPFSDVFAKASGWALMEAPSREALIGHVKEFLKVAGDGECEIMPIFSPPPSP
ncbi:MAG TPA: hypothetical protein VG983_01690, partial [Caulobacterales bacterium]|nr:hypothetical protein [Caulobacterales bacterium]